MVKCLLRILTAAVLAMVAWACADDRQEDRIPGMDIVSRLSGTMAEGRYSDALSIADTLLFMPEDSVSAEARKIARGYKALAYIMSNKLDSAENYVYELTEMLKTDTGSYYNSDRIYRTGNICDKERTGLFEGDIGVSQGDGSVCKI